TTYSLSPREHRIQGRSGVFPVNNNRPTPHSSDASGGPPPGASNSLPMTWGLRFRVQQFVKGSLWLLPVVGGFVGWALAIAAADSGTIWKLPSSWTYSTGTAQALLAAVVGASVGLTGFVVTVSVLIVLMATGTFSARYMRLFYRDRVLKAVLAVLVGTLTFSY